MLLEKSLPSPGPLLAAVRAAYRMDETDCVGQRLRQAALPAESRDRIEAAARKLVEGVRKQRVRVGGIDAFMHEYELSSNEGVVLLCLAEALLRIPDANTAERLIRDKIGGADWERHLGHSDSGLCKRLHLGVDAYRTRDRDGSGGRGAGLAGSAAQIGGAVG